MWQEFADEPDAVASANIQEEEREEAGRSLRPRTCTNPCSITRKQCAFLAFSSRRGYHRRELIQWALTAAVGGLSAVLWYLGPQSHRTAGMG